MAAQNWLVIVREPDGVTIRASYSWTTSTLTYSLPGLSAATPWTATITPAYAYVEALDWEVEPSGNCLDASFIGDSLGSILDVQPRDVVTIYTLGYRSGEDAGVYYARYRGVAVVPANALHGDGQPHAYHLQGLYKVLAYVDTVRNVNHAAGVDIGGLLSEWAVNQLGLASDTPVTYHDGVGSWDLLGVGSLPCGMGIVKGTLGVTTQAAVNPGVASLGQYLSKLAQLATGAGVDSVWGVDANGFAFLRARGASSASWVEAVGGVVVAPQDVQADEVIQRVHWAIADGDANQAVRFGTGDAYALDTPDTLTYRTALQSGAYEDVTIAKDPPSGVNVFKQIPISYWVAPGIGGSNDGYYVQSYVGDSLDNVGLDWSSAPFSGGDYTSTPLPLAAALNNPIPSGSSIIYYGQNSSAAGAAANEARLLTSQAASAGDTALYGTLTITEGVGPLYFSSAVSGSAAVLDRMADGDPISYVVKKTNLNLAAVASCVFNGYFDESDVAKISVNIKLSDGSGNVVAGTEGQFRYYVVADGGVLKNYHSILDAMTSPQSVQKEFVFGDRARNIDMGPLRVTGFTLAADLVNGTIGSGQPQLTYFIQDFRVFSLDTGLLDQLAEQEYKTPRLQPLCATIDGEQTPTDLVNVTTRSGVAVSDSSVERVAYSIYGRPQPGPIPKGGVRTHIYTSERADPKSMFLVRAIQRTAKDAVLKAQGKA